jgi:hypothetical protein
MLHKRIKVVVTVPKAKGQALTAVVDRLREVGLDIAKVHDKLGLVTGSIESDKMDSLSEVEGVSSARVERAIQLVSPPPEG